MGPPRQFAQAVLVSHATTAFRRLVAFPDPTLSTLAELRLSDMGILEVERSPDARIYQRQSGVQTLDFALQKLSIVLPLLITRIS